MTDECIDNDLKFSIVKDGNKYNYIIGEDEKDIDYLMPGDISDCTIPEEREE